MIRKTIPAYIIISALFTASAFTGYSEGSQVYASETETAEKNAAEPEPAASETADKEAAEAETSEDPKDSAGREGAASDNKAEAAERDDASEEGRAPAKSSESGASFGGMYIELNGEQADLTDEKGVLQIGSEKLIKLLNEAIENGMGTVSANTRWKEVGKKDTGREPEELEEVQVENALNTISLSGGGYRGTVYVSDGAFYADRELKTRILNILQIDPRLIPGKEEGAFRGYFLKGDEDSQVRLTFADGTLVPFQNISELLPDDGNLKARADYYPALTFRNGGEVVDTVYFDYMGDLNEYAKLYYDYDFTAHQLLPSSIRTSAAVPKDKAAYSRAFKGYSISENGVDIMVSNDEGTFCNSRGKSNPVPVVISEDTTACAVWDRFTTVLLKGGEYKQLLYHTGGKFYQGTGPDAAYAAGAIETVDIYADAVRTDGIFRGYYLTDSEGKEIPFVVPLSAGATTGRIVFDPAAYRLDHDVTAEARWVYKITLKNTKTTLGTVYYSDGKFYSDSALKTRIEQLVPPKDSGILAFAGFFFYDNGRPIARLTDSDGKITFDRKLYEISSSCVANPIWKTLDEISDETDSQLEAAEALSAEASEVKKEDEARAEEAADSLEGGAGESVSGEMEESLLTFTAVNLELGSSGSRVCTIYYCGENDKFYWDKTTKGGSIGHIDSRYPELLPEKDSDSVRSFFDTKGTRVLAVDSKGRIRYDSDIYNISGEITLHSLSSAVTETSSAEKNAADDDNIYIPGGSGSSGGSSDNSGNTGGGKSKPSRKLTDEELDELAEQYGPEDEEPASIEDEKGESSSDSDAGSGPL